MSTATRNVQTTMDNTVGPQSANTFINQIRYDAASAQSMTAFGTTAPTAGSFCSSQLSSSFSSWLWSPSGTSPVLRSLVNLRIPSPSTSAAATWSELADKTVGYEIRREAGGAGRDIELWRVECSGSSITRQAMMMRLGPLVFSNGGTLAFGGGFPDGSNFLLCPGTSPKFATAPASATSSSVAFSVDSSTTTVSGEGVWFLDMNSAGTSIYGTAGAASGTTITITPRFYRNVPVTSTTSLSLRGSTYLFARPCSAGVGTLFTNNSYVALNLPYFGRTPGVRNLPVILLKSRLV